MLWSSSAASGSKDAEEDEDQVAFIDDDGNSCADEETINSVDNQIGEYDAEHAHAVMTFTEAKMHWRMQG